MRFIQAFLMLCICLLPQAMCQCIDTYEPGCKLPDEWGLPQRHCIDPTKYWYCPRQGSQAILRKCQPNTGFDQDRDACIPWIDWKWKECHEPPSRPTTWVPCF